MPGRVTEQLNLGSITASLGKETGSTERRMEQREARGPRQRQIEEQPGDFQSL